MMCYCLIQTKYDKETWERADRHIKWIFIGNVLKKVMFTGMYGTEIKKNEAFKIIPSSLLSWMVDERVSHIFM